MSFRSGPAGVLERRGQTEAAVDLARQAALGAIAAEHEPASVA
jgi:3,4-dihydroxy-2-butanone 4-phosphate synthase